MLFAVTDLVTLLACPSYSYSLLLERSSQPRWFIVSLCWLKDAAALEKIEDRVSQDRKVEAGGGKGFRDVREPRGLFEEWRAGAFLYGRVVLRAQKRYSVAPWGGERGRYVGAPGARIEIPSV
jgi:hypothetical protein